MTPDTTDPIFHVAREEVLEALQGLIRCPSVNPTLAPDEGQDETAVATWATEWLNARGVDASLEPVAPGRPNAVARIRGGDGPTLVLCAHLDTVATAGMTIDPFDPRVEGDRVYGRGSFDMKCGAAAAMAAATTLARTGFGGTLMLALVADEEYASLGAQHFVKHHRADACIVTEPSDEELILAHKGFVWLSIRTSGKAAHGSRWDLGDSAIARAGRIVAALDAFDRDVLRLHTHPLCGPASMHCGLIEGGEGISTYAPTCTMKVERRTLPGEDGAEVVREIEAVIADCGEAATVEIMLERLPMTTPPDAPIAVAVRDAATDVIGAAPKESGVPYWMDAAIFHAAGIPTVDIGPSGEGAHAAVEWVSLDSTVRCAQTLVGAASRFCG